MDERSLAEDVKVVGAVDIDWLGVTGILGQH